jgi:hypothetical protein
MYIFSFEWCALCTECTVIRVRETHTRSCKEISKFVSYSTDRLTDRKDKQKLKLGRLMKKGGVEKLEDRQRNETRDR